MRAVIVAAGWIVGWVLLWRPPVLARARTGAGAERPPAAVVVPARDEADRLPRLLASLVAQVRPGDEVVVVDDHSRDATAAVAAGFADVRVVAAPPLPEGWTGKSWACQVGVDATTAPVLVLLDADVVLADGALDAAIAEGRDGGGLLSVQPRHDVAAPVEVLSLLFNVVAVMGLGIATPLRRGPEWGAAGPLLVARREDHARAGGHAGVAGDVAEDLALAAAFRRVGLPVRCVLGGAAVRFRMYRDLRGLVEGWRKNMATGARRTPAGIGLAIALWVTALVASAASVVALLPDAPLLAAGLYAGVAAQVAVLGRHVGRFGPAALAWPLLVAAFVVVVAWSAVATFVVRRVTWSDRSIAIAAGPAAARPGPGSRAG